jgi:AAA+ superfamily predicted ATPase
MTNSLSLHEAFHPQDDAQQRYDGLIGIDNQKDALLSELVTIFNPTHLIEWQKKHHPKGLPIVSRFNKTLPLIALTGEVGCGKTELAHSIASPLAKTLDARVIVLETPSNIRGNGMVGELSNRITEVFTIAKSKIPSRGYGILIIDEADDLATDRDQNQAHHEDRAGLNVLIKQVDQLKNGGIKLAVILITNRLAVLDPAVRRRFSLELTFHRPTGEALISVFKKILEGTTFSEGDIKDLCAICSKKENAFSYSDLFLRVARQALISARKADVPFGFNIVKKILEETTPSPLIKVSKIS